jgi:hypothetical protein
MPQLHFLTPALPVMALAWLGLSASAQAREPVIDMHLHIDAADAQGPPPQTICAPYREWPGKDPAEGEDDYVGRLFRSPDCPRKLVSARDDDDLRVRSIDMLRKHDVYALGGGSPERVARWLQDAPDRIMPAVDLTLTNPPDLARLRALHKEGRVKALAEILVQYEGIAVTDPRLEPYFSLAEELDVPVGIHMGPGPPGVAYFGAPGYRMALTDPLQLEPVLVKHPRLRVFVMHAGWPMLERTIALMYAHPQVYVDIGVIDTVFPEAEFHRYLRGLIDAGFGKRIMFGSDQMVWPELIEVAIERVQRVPGLSPAQRRAILYDNAARFLRIDPAGTGARSRQRDDPSPRDHANIVPRPGEGPETGSVRPGSNTRGAQPVPRGT